MKSNGGCLQSGPCPSIIAKGFEERSSGPFGRRKALEQWCLRSIFRAVGSEIWLRESWNRQRSHLSAFSACANVAPLIIKPWTRCLFTSITRPRFNGRRSDVDCVWESLVSPKVLFFHRTFWSRLHAVRILHRRRTAEIYAALRRCEIWWDSSREGISLSIFRPLITKTIAKTR